MRLIVRTRRLWLRLEQAADDERGRAVFGGIVQWQHAILIHDGAHWSIRLEQARDGRLRLVANGRQRAATLANADECILCDLRRHAQRNKFLPRE